MSASKAGLYDEILTQSLAEELKLPSLTDRASIRALSAPELLARAPDHLARLIRARLEQAPEHERLSLLQELYTSLSHALSRTQTGDAQLLEAISPAPHTLPELIPPHLPLSASALIANDTHHPNLAALLRRELPSCQSVDLICAFIKWSGLRLLLTQLQDLTARGHRVRVLTTTYMGVSEPRALEELERAGAQIKVCFETHATRLHAKAWLLERAHHGTTLYVGSSNLSASALTDGMEWNVRLGQRHAPHVVNRFRTLFKTYWSDALFEDYDAERFAQAIARLSTPRPERVMMPLPHQRAILEQLDVERRLHQRHKNLVVAATGTGKTVVAAFDFARVAAKKPGTTLLFVAHRKDILTQSMRTFRDVLQDERFGELLVDGERPERWAHVFASIQSLAGSALEHLSAGAFDMVIMDECHHIGARTYAAVLDHFEPDILLGLTATPERADGVSILDRFEGTIAAEIRLWDAIEQHLLVPFHYFGIHDGTDLSTLTWRNSGYDTGALTNLYTADDARAQLIHTQLQRIVTEPAVMRAIGFCVSIAHAQFMARTFERFGYACIALTSQSTRAERDTAPARLARGELQIIFTVDLYNEGVDIPCVDTLLMLRPTESATIFLQQLGRGLRHAPGKSCLTVLDFIGHAHASFRFGARYGALLGKQDVSRGIEEQELLLPEGCAFELDEISRREILERLKEHIKPSLKQVEDALKTYPAGVSLLEFAQAQDLSIPQLYRSGSWYWTKLMASAGHLSLSPYNRAVIESVGERINRVVHMDDVLRLRFYKEVLSGTRTLSALSVSEERLVCMLHNQLWGSAKPASSAQQAMATLMSEAPLREEFMQLCDSLEERAQFLTTPLAQLDALFEHVPLSVHGTYTRAELLSALGELSLGQKCSSREGVYYARALGVDLFFVTLDKSADAYAPQVMYNDYPIDTRHFHWESQNATSAATSTGRRYIDPERSGGALLCVRDRDKIAGQSQPFRLLGPLHYISHDGERPMSITWELEVEMPQRLLQWATQALSQGM